MLTHWSSWERPEATDVVDYENPWLHAEILLATDYDSLQFYLALRMLPILISIMFLKEIQPYYIMCSQPLCEHWDQKKVSFPIANTLQDYEWK